MPLLRVRENPDRRFLGTFAVGLIVLFAVLGWIRWSRGDATSATLLWAIGCGVGLVALAVPRLAAIVYRGWMAILAPFAWVVSMLVLTLVYLGVITPIALAMRLTGRDPLSLRTDTTKSLWTKRDRQPEPGSYFRQF